MTTSSDGGAEDMIPGPPPYASLLEGILIDIVLEDDIASSVIRFEILVFTFDVHVNM